MSAIVGMLIGAVLAWGGSRVRRTLRPRATTPPPVGEPASTAETTVRPLVRLLERDRHRIARHLHDGPIQDLLAADMETNVATYLGDTSEVALDVAPVVRTLRRISEGLAPPALHAFGLAAALATQAVRFEEEHAGVTVHLDADPLPDLPPPVALALFRIVQEALNNVGLHADATRADVVLARTPAGVEVTIADDGRGTASLPDPAVLVGQGRYGLFEMTAHAESVGGILRLDSAPGATRVHVMVPDASLARHARSDSHPDRR